LRLKLTLAYRGTAYHGWQSQGDHAAVPTVQDAVRLSLQRTVGHPVVLTGSSRTDTGVHAKGQTAHFDTIHENLPPDGLRRGLNSNLPGDIICRRAEKVADAFHSIADARLKQYRYHFWDDADRPIFAADRLFHRPRGLDAEAMAAAGQHLVGEHDFTSFVRPGHGRPSCVRTITAIQVKREGHRVTLAVTGGGFLWNQVRIIAGTLADVGGGRLKPDDLPDMLAAKDRTQGGPTAPAHGLFLQWIRFGDVETK
jgi:tRNA pseudouridine38-40 synthase